MFLQHAAGTVFLVRLLGLGLSRKGELRAGVAVLVIGFGLWAFHNRNRFSLPIRVALLSGIFAFAAVFSFRQVQIIREHAQAPPPWDFQVFWIYGQLTAQGANVYETAPYQPYKNLLEAQSDFVQSVIDVGATYPPPTLFLFRPLGWSDLRTTYLPWQFFTCACVVGSILLLWRLFLSESGAWGLALAALAVIVLHSTWLTLRVAQTNFLVMLPLLLYWRDRELPRGGLWLALGAVVKLDVVLVALFPVVRRQWRQLAWAVGTGIAISAAGLAWLGPKIFFSYFTEHPTSRLPFWVYTEEVNQSLSAVILRRTGEVVGRSPLAQPLYIALGVLIVICTVCLVHRARNSEWSLSLVIATALLLYPGTLVHYGVVLLGPLMLVWRIRGTLPYGPWLSGGLIAWFYLMIGLAQRNCPFIAFVMLWVAFAAGILWLPDQPGERTSVVA